MQTGVISAEPEPDSGVASDRVLEFGAVGRALWRKRKWIFVPALIVAALATVTVNLLTPRYKSESRVLIEAHQNVFVRPEAEKAGDRDRNVVDQEAVASKVQLALSRDLARQVIKQLKLGDLPEFDPVLRGFNPFSQVLQLVGLAKDPLRMAPEERIFDAYFDRLNVYPVDKSRVFAVEFQSYDPDLAARAANTVVDNFVALELKSQQEETHAAGRWLAGEIEVLRQKLADAEAKVEGFRAKSNLFIGTNNTTLSNQQLGELNSQLAAARSQKADAEAKARFIRDALKTGQSLESADFLNSELIRRLGEQRATLRGQLAEQSSTLLDNHPRIKELKAQIADLDRQIKGEGERLARSLENDARISGSRVETLGSSLDQLKQQAASTNEQDIQLRALEREAKAQRDLLESYLAKYREISSRENLGAVPSDVRVISRAIVSNTPYFPKKVPIVLIAALATLLIAAGFITTGELMASGIIYRGAAPAPHLHDAEYPERTEPAMTEVAAHEAPIAAEAPDHAVAELAAAVAGEGGKRIVVSGVARQSGTTQTALALARELGMHARVVLVDLAFAHPGVAEHAVDPAAPGMTDLVRGGASFGTIISRDRDSRVHLVAAGRAGPDGPAILASERLAVTLDALGRAYDHVVIDAGVLSEHPPEPLLRGAPRAVLVAPGMSAEEAEGARARLLGLGFADAIIFAAQAPSHEAAPADHAAAA